MTKTIKTPIIIHNGWGSYTAYPATVERAKALLQEKVVEMPKNSFPALALVDILLEIKAGNAATQPYLVGNETVGRLLEDIVRNPVGTESRTLHRFAETDPQKDTKQASSKEMQDAVVLWAFEHKISLDQIHLSPEVLNKVHPEKTFDFMRGLLARAGTRTIEYVYTSDLDTAEELKQLLHGGWKDTAKVENVVNRYLTAIEQFCHRDEKYHLGVLEVEVEAEEEEVAPLA